MKHVRVLIVNGESILSGGVESLLSQENDITIIKIGLDLKTTLTDEILLLQPDVVILDENEEVLDAVDPVDLIRILPHMRVLVMNNHNSKVYVYQKQEIVVMHPIDLVAAIRNH